MVAIQKQKLEMKEINKWRKTLVFWFAFHWRLCPGDSKSESVQAMPWRRIDAKPPEAILTQFTDAYMRH